MLDFIINPVAGGKNGKKMQKNLALIKARLEEKKVEYAFHFTEYKNHGKVLASELIDKGATDVIVVGGDGTLHEVINGFHSFHRVSLGLIPCGTGNDFARALKLPTNPIKALDVILYKKSSYTDFMQMPTVRGMNIIGMGIDVDVLKRYESLKKKSKFGYTKCLIKTLFDFEYSKFNAIVDDQKEHYNSFIACIANGCVYGGGIPVCPPADPTDGKLDFVAVRAMKKIKIINAFLKLKAGKVLSLKESVYKQGEEITIETDMPYTVNVDGELYENIPFNVKIVSNTLMMYR